jgi:hypothetical protein
MCNAWWACARRRHPHWRGSKVRATSCMHATLQQRADACVGVSFLSLKCSWGLSCEEFRQEPCDSVCLHDSATGHSPAPVVVAGPSNAPRINLTAPSATQCPLSGSIPSSSVPAAHAHPAHLQQPQTVSASATGQRHAVPAGLVTSKPGPALTSGALQVRACIDS